MWPFDDAQTRRRNTILDLFEKLATKQRDENQFLHLEADKIKTERIEFEEEMKLLEKENDALKKEITDFDNIIRYNQAVKNAKDIRDTPHFFELKQKMIYDQLEILKHVTSLLSERENNIRHCYDLLTTRIVPLLAKLNELRANDQSMPKREYIATTEYYSNALLQFIRAKKEMQEHNMQSVLEQERLLRVKSDKEYQKEQISKRTSELTELAERMIKSERKNVKTTDNTKSILRRAA